MKTTPIPPVARTAPPDTTYTRTSWDEEGSDPGAPETWQYAGPWRAVVERRRCQLANDLSRLDRLTESQARERAHLRTLLKDAESAAQAKVGLAKWWWGTEIERAWARLHEVDERLVDLVPESELEPMALDTVARAEERLEKSDTRVVALEAARAEVTTGRKPPAALRPLIHDVLRAAHERSDRDNAAARFLRNRIMLGSGASFVLAAGLLVLQRRLDDVAFVDPVPALDQRPATYLFLVMTFGAVGALLTAMSKFTEISSDHSPFNLPLQQAILKLAFGPLVACIGFVVVGAIESTDAVNTDVLPIGSPSTLPAAFLLAVVFGSAQQIVTRLVDRRAGKIIDAIAPEEEK